MTPGSSDSSSHPAVTQYPPPATHSRRPWRDLLSPSSLSLPTGYADAMSRFRRNAILYRHNYSAAVLSVVFLSLLWHPISIFVFVVFLALWILLFFSRENAIAPFGLPIDDRFVILGLSIVTICTLVLTGVGVNVLVALIVGVLLIGLHAAFRSSDDEISGDGSDGFDGFVSLGGADRPLSSF